MDRKLLEKAQKLINANYVSTTLSTVDSEYNVNVAVINILEFINDDTILCARFGANRTYHNLLQTGKGVFMVLDSDEEEKRKDGIRVAVELVDDIQEGEYFDRIAKRLVDSKYAMFPLKNCLVFKVTDILPVSLLKKE